MAARNCHLIRVMLDSIPASARCVALWQRRSVAERARSHVPGQTGDPPRGQVIIMFALFLVAMIGMLGLATDVGYAMSQRRAVQNAADAGALAGARQLTKYPDNAPIAAEITSFVEANALGSVIPTVEDCQYMTYSSEISSCSGAVPSSATGVRVVVREEHDPFFIQVVGFSGTVSTEASASAHVQTATYSDGPFIVCGEETYLAEGNGPNPPKFSILLADGTINPDAVGRTFRVHHQHVAGCDLHPNDFKGRAVDNTGKGLNEFWDGDNGTRAGPTRSTVRGIEGCDEGLDTFNGCILILPIAVSDPPATKHGNNIRFYVVQLAAFRVTDAGGGSSGNRHNGTLLGTYLIDAPGENEWELGQEGVTTVRLTS